MSHSLSAEVIDRIEKIVEKVHGPGNIVSISQPTNILIVEVKVLRRDGCEISYLIPGNLPPDQGLILKMAEFVISQRSYAKDANDRIDLSYLIE